MSRIRLSFFITLLAISVMTGALAMRGNAARAYSNTGYHWPYGSPVYVDVTIGSSIPYSWTTPISAGESAWNGVGAKFRYRAGYANHTVNYKYLGANRTLGHTTCYASGSTLTDCDVDFNSYQSWSTSGEAGKYDVQSVATHEFGHWLRLGDLWDYSDYGKTMYYSTDPGTTFVRTLEQDDINGIVAIYGR